MNQTTNCSAQLIAYFTNLSTPRPPCQITPLAVRHLHASAGSVRSWTQHFCLPLSSWKTKLERSSNSPPTFKSSAKNDYRTRKVGSPHNPIVLSVLLSYRSGASSYFVSNRILRQLHFLNLLMSQVSLAPSLALAIDPLAWED